MVHITLKTTVSFIIIFVWKFKTCSFLDLPTCYLLLRCQSFLLLFPRQGSIRSVTYECHTPLTYFVVKLLIVRKSRVPAWNIKIHKLKLQPSRIILNAWNRETWHLFKNFAHFITQFMSNVKKMGNLFSWGFAQYQVCIIFFFFTLCKLNQAELSNVFPITMKGLNPGVIFPILFPNISCLWIAILKYASRKDILKNVTY